MGWTVEKIVDKGEKGGFFVLNHLVRVGKYTYTDTARGKNLNVIEQLTQQYHNQGGHFYFALKFQVFQVFQTIFSPFSSGFLIGR